VDVEAPITAMDRSASATSRHDAEAPAAAPATQRAAGLGVGVDDEEVPLSNIRRITARRLTESVATPHIYLTGTVEAVQLLRFRKDINERLLEGHTKVSVNDLLVRACAVAQRIHPAVNASWAGDKILRHRRINVGVAVAIDDGLVVPVIRDTDRKSLREIARETYALVDRARTGRLAPEEFTGGTHSPSATWGCSVSTV
jgi:pyruvate dehydrogenase E2 component (dihydrolipoamide acetyltransferase)